MGNFPLTPCTFIVIPLLIPLYELVLGPQYWGYLHKNSSLAYSSFASSASAYGGLLFLLNNLATPDFGPLERAGVY